MSADRQKIIDAMSGDYAYSFRVLSENTGVPEKRVREVVRSLKSEGLAEYGVLYDEDEPFMRGSGYWLSDEGLDLKSPGVWCVE